MQNFVVLELAIFGERRDGEAAGVRRREPHQEEALHNGVMGQTQFNDTL